MGLMNRRVLARCASALFTSSGLYTDGTELLVGSAKINWISVEINYSGEYSIT